MRCCICHSENHSFHIETGPMMVDVNKDRNYLITQYDIKKLADKNSRNIYLDINLLEFY